MPSKPIWNVPSRGIPLPRHRPRTFPDHERLIGALARSVGFTHVSESAARSRGKSAKEPLDVEATRRAFEELAEEINASIEGEKKSLDEIVYG
jgi:N-methylhydantoinase A/oxoprolinase/acetone carboxylase beta subunit